MGETLGERIAALRHAAGLSQPQLAARAGISTGTLRNWEQGTRQPLPKGLAAIAKGLGLSPGPLLEGVAFPGDEVDKAPPTAEGPRGRQEAAPPPTAPEQPAAKQPRLRGKAQPAPEASQPPPAASAEEPAAVKARGKKGGKAPAAAEPASEPAEVQPSAEKPAAGKAKSKKRKEG